MNYPAASSWEYNPGIPNSIAQTGSLAGSIPLLLQPSLHSFSASVIDLTQQKLKLLFVPCPAVLDYVIG